LLELDRDAQSQYHGPYLHRRQANGTWTAGTTIGTPVTGMSVMIDSSGSNLTALVATGNTAGASTYVGKLPTGGTWSWQQLPVIKASVATRPNGTPVVAGVSGTTLLVYDGASSTPVTSTETLTPSWAGVAIDATGTIHVAFSEIGAQKRIGYAKRQADGTYPVEWVAGFSSYEQPSLAFDPTTGRPVIAFADYFTGRVFIATRP